MLKEFSENFWYDKLFVISGWDLGTKVMLAFGRFYSWAGFILFNGKEKASWSSIKVFVFLNQICFRYSFWWQLLARSELSWGCCSSTVLCCSLHSPALCRNLRRQDKHRQTARKVSLEKCGFLNCLVKLITFHVFQYCFITWRVTEALK